MADRVAAWTQAPFGDLETRGFVLLRGFLSPEELEFHRAEFDRQPVDAANRNYSLSPVRGRALEAMAERVRDVLGRVASTTGLRPDLAKDGCYFATGRGIRFDWHQDHESFFAVQNHYDYLNFYIPIRKPVRDKSNLCVIPFDVLARESPRIHARVARAGASTYALLRAGTLVFHDDQGRVSYLGRDLERLAEVPQLEAGDLLLLRGDMIHRTQDADTDRVALSFRAVCSGSRVQRARLADGGLTKAWMMMNDAYTYERMFRAFECAGQDALSYADLQKAMESVPPFEPMGRKRFFRFLLGQKRRERLLWRFFRRSVSFVLVSLLIAPLRRARPSRAPGPPPA